jgi:hypothetical protein
MIKKITQMYRDYWDKKKQRDEILSLISPDENYISYISDKGQVLIRISVQNVTDDEARKFGETLFCLSNGFYVVDTIAILKDLQNQDHERALFVEKAMKRWHELVAKAEKNDYNNIDAPVVSPRAFMKRDVHEQQTQQ